MIRDVNSNALISTDIIARDKYRLEKQRIRQIEKLREDVANLQEKVDNICRVIDKIIREN